MVKSRKLLFLLIFLLFTFFVKGQDTTMTKENGVVLYCAAGSMVWINGSFHNIGDSLYNLGEFHVAGENIFDNEGDFVNDGKVSGNGKYFIAGHWVNNKLFKSGTSEVIMDNTPGGIPSIVTNQLITGTQQTSFYDLTLIGIGIKAITSDDFVTHYLNLNDRELAVDNHTLYVTNTDPLAITRTSGFVSNLTNGWLSRTTGVIGPYSFPMGSSDGPMRYRPVDIKTNNDSLGEYVVGFFNYSGSDDGFFVGQKDNTICMVDSLYYHKIHKTFGMDTTVDITIYFDPVTDGPWNGMANWHMDSLTDEWMNMWPTSKLYSPMWGIKKSGWNNWDNLNLPYALIARVPDAIPIDGPPEVCLGTGPVNYYAYGVATDSYIWSVNGGHIVGDSTFNTVQVQWDSAGTGTVSVQEVQQWGYCVGLQSNYTVTIYPQPIASFAVVPHDTAHIFAYDLIHFVDLSQNAAQWSWEFGDGSPSSQQSPYHVYEKPGIYTVCLYIATEHDCIDDTCLTVEVVEGLDIPNVFTPNGDGFNDDFNIHASGISQYFLQVFNRWGVLLFESSSPYVKWDGKTMSGENCADGTYYYILSAKSESNDYSQHGFVTLLRN
jgi:gliding motility-associated-like protein